MKKNQRSLRLGVGVIGALAPLFFALPTSAVAATRTWTGQLNDYYAHASNWESSIAPSPGDDVVFPASALNQTVDNNGMGVSLRKIKFSGEVSGSSSKSYTITGNEIGISSAIEAIMTGSGGDHAVETSITLSDDVTFLTSGSNTLSVGAEGETIDIGSHSLTIDAGGGTITLLGEIEGSGTLTKSGDGKLKLMASPGSGYTGSIALSDGELSVDETFGSANITIDGGTLKGSGSIGTITMTSGSIAPGNSPGCLNSSDMTLSGGSYDVELGGTSVSNCEYDNMVVTGSVKLGSATTLNVSLISGYAPSKDDTYSIIFNDGNDAVEGTFKGLDDGDKFTLGSYTYQIDYSGGDGNDVTLKVTGTPTAPDTGSESVLQNPWVTLVLAAMVAVVVAGYRFIEKKKSKI